jgi:hypothetical protein
MPGLIAACLALASVSLLLPSEPSYDPWAWLVWGREITHLELDTTGGPTWKPLPVAVTALIAPVGEDVSVATWVVLARAGALLALALAFRLAARLAGGSVALRALAGTVALGALALTPDWFQFAAHANEAPLAVALMLWAVERHLDSRREQAFVLGVLVCLMRPELFPFLALYSIWLWRAEPARRRLVTLLLALLPLAWLLPEWIGSGNPLDGGEQARSEPLWSLSHAEQPWLRALERAHNHVGLPAELLCGAALLGALVRRQGAVLVLAAAALAEGALFVAMTQAGFSGNPRYVLPALAIASVLAGVGAARVVEAFAGAVQMLAGLWGRGRRGRIFRRPAPLPRLAGAAVALAGIALLAAPFVGGRAGRLEFEVREVGERMELHRDLARAVRAAGGADAIAAIGSATTNRALHSRLAWELGRPIEDVERGFGHRVVFWTPKEVMAGPLVFWGRARERHRMARVGSWEVYRREGLTYRLFTSRLQGFDIPRSSGARGTYRVLSR